MHAFRLSALGLIAVVLLLTIPAATAAPAEPFELDYCNASADYTFCWQERGVIQRLETASGNNIAVVNSHGCYQVYDADERVDEMYFTTHDIQPEQDGETQTHHSRREVESTFEIGDTAHLCTSTYTLVLANGEVHHEDIQTTCTTPL